MKMYIGVIKKELLAFGHENEHEGYVIAESDKSVIDGGKQTAILDPEGRSNFEMFNGHLCKLSGTLEGLRLTVKMIESLDDPELVWSI
jgi:hypothetical protein